MGIAVATMVVFSAVMKRVDWAVAESACESGSLSQSLQRSFCRLSRGPLEFQKKKRRERERVHETISCAINPQLLTKRAIMTVSVLDELGRWTGSDRT